MLPPLAVAATSSTTITCTALTRTLSFIGKGGSLTLNKLYVRAFKDHVSPLGVRRMGAMLTTMRWAVREPAPIVRESLLSAAIAGPTSVERIEVARIELAPSQASGRHRHPCQVVGYVVSGTIRFQIAGDAEATLEAGAAFHEPAGREIAHFDNASDQESATFVACYLLPPGEERLIEML